MSLCTKCNTREMVIKKRGLCEPCYQKLRKQNGPFLKFDTNEPLTHTIKEAHSKNREIAFIQNFFTHNNWVHQPCSFRLPNGNYAPDFYDKDRNVFIEVAGTRQAYHANKYKYDEFKNMFPKLILEIRAATGDLLDDIPSGQKWGHQYSSQKKRSITN